MVWWLHIYMAAVYGCQILHAAYIPYKITLCLMVKKITSLKCGHACGCYPITTTSGNSVSCIKIYLPFEQ